ncbi:MAG TPA: diaminobutyrate acetyltransferase [Pseudogracilibacillus sp.]|nr:diaminobutyrate acetyltransferase [Pseudogracilibacillus sp.]
MIEFRKPTADDGKEMFRIVRESKVLDVNSEYSYLLWGKYFSDTSILAVSDNEVIGFISGFIPPDQADTLFIWQVAVDGSFKGHGIATKLIAQLLARVNKERSIEFIEATVTPSNIPSRRLFDGFAQKNNTKCVVSECFTEKQFSGEGHEAEFTFRIGPIFN